MKLRPQIHVEFSPIRKQRGIVLFITLIALVSMMLAAVALLRSVDTATVVAGNLAFKQAATLSADEGASSAMTWMNTAPDFTTDNTVLGYYATTVNSTANPRWLMTDATWNNVSATTGSAQASGTGINPLTGRDGSDNRIRFIIERLCRTTGAPTLGTCLFGAQAAATSINSMAVVDATGAGAPTGPGSQLPSPMYRITSRVDGPRNTVSYTQVIVY